MYGSNPWNILVLVTLGNTCIIYLAGIQNDSKGEISEGPVTSLHNAKNAHWPITYKFKLNFVCHQDQIHSTKKHLKQFTANQPKPINHYHLLVVGEFWEKKCLRHYLVNLMIKSKPKNT